MTSPAIDPTFHGCEGSFCYNHSGASIDTTHRCASIYSPGFPLFHTIPLVTSRLHSLYLLIQNPFIQQNSSCQYEQRGPIRVLQGPEAWNVCLDDTLIPPPVILAVSPTDCLITDIQSSSGLRKKVTVFQQPHYSESFVTSILLSIPEGVKGESLLVSTPSTSVVSNLVIQILSSSLVVMADTGTPRLSS